MVLAIGPKVPGQESNGESKKNVLTASVEAEYQTQSNVVPDDSMVLYSSK